ncbi:MAG: DUF4296 domain-containing protein [Balneolaceae bacterium]|nr:MAG: DUF4296 domain-containing protein [Balneolaceae bacterium]
MKYLPVLFILILFMAAACDEPVPPDLLPEETYKRMFVEFTIINQYDELLLQGRSREELRDKVYEHYGVTPEEFRNSHRYYESNIERQLKRIDEINLMMRAERDTLIEAEKRYHFNRRTPADTLRQRILNR